MPWMRCLLSGLVLVLITFRALAAPPAPSEGSAGLQPKGLRPTQLTARDADVAFAPIRYAIVVGVNRTADAQVTPLQYAELDALEMATALRDPSIGSFDRVVTLTAPDQASLLRALEEAAQTLRAQDLFFFYFSGHGTASLDDDLRTTLFLQARDTVLSQLDRTGISVRGLQTLLERMKARRKVMLIDACYNGDGKSGLSNRTRERLRQTKGAATVDLADPLRESEAQLFAAAIGQPALEDPQLGGGVYSHYFLEALIKTPRADANNDGAVSVAEAHNYARDKTMTRTGFRQVPWANYRIVGREDIYLAGQRRAGAEKALLYSFNERYSGARVLINGQEKGTLPSSLEVDPGTYQLTVQAPGGTVLFRRVVQMDALHSIRVDDLESVLNQQSARVRRYTWTGAGVTMGLGVAAAVTGLTALNYHSIYTTAELNGQEEADEVRRLGQGFQVATNVLLGSVVVCGVSTALFRWQVPSRPLRSIGLKANVVSRVPSDHSSGEAARTASPLASWQVGLDMRF